MTKIYSDTADLKTIKKQIKKYKTRFSGVMSDLYMLEIDINKNNLSKKEQYLMYVKHNPNNTEKNENKELNNLDFHIENSALSTKKMIQKKPDLLEYITGGLGGDTQISDIVLDGYNSINIISFSSAPNTLIKNCFNSLSILDSLPAEYNLVFIILLL